VEQGRGLMHNYAYQSYKAYEHQTSTPLISSKRGPKDGWHGITLKVLKIALRRSIVTTSMIAKYFNITRRGARYHLRKLVIMGYLIRMESKKHDPFTYYVINRLVPAILVKKAVQISPRIGMLMFVIIKRYLRYNPVKAGEYDRRYISILEKYRLVIRTGGKSCRYAYIIPNVGYPNYMEHRHKYTKRNRY